MVYEEIIQESAEEFLPSKEIDAFINSCYNRVFDAKNINPKNYQARASITGEVFERSISKIFDHYYDMDFERGENFPEMAMSRGGGADFSVSQEDAPVCIIEAKGSAKKLETEDGFIEPNRPGLQRTDTAKKAVAQAYQANRVYPDCLFYLLTSNKPKEGTNSKDILELAEGDIIDGIVNIYRKEEMDEMVDQVKRNMKEIKEV